MKKPLPVDLIPMTPVKPPELAKRHNKMHSILMSFVDARIFSTNVLPRAWLPALFCFGTLTSVLPATERAVHWDFSLQTSGEDVFWSSPSAIEPELPAYRYTYNLTQLDIRVGNIFPVWISLLSQVDSSYGDGAHRAGLPLYFYDDFFEDEESGSQAQLKLVIDEAGWGRGSITDIVLGNYRGLSIRAIRAAGSVALSGIEKPSFVNWQARHFDLADEKRIAPKADPGSYGIPNLLRYALNLDPHRPDRSLLPVAGIEGTKKRYSTFTYTRLAGADDVEYIVELSSDLITWSPVQDPVIVIKPASNGVTETVTLRESVPTTGSGFMRLRVRLMGEGK